MSDAETYDVGVPSEVNRYNDTAGKVESGWEFPVTWKSTGAQFTVFVAGDAPSAKDVDAAIRAKGATVEQYGKLGA